MTTNFFTEKQSVQRAEEVVKKLEDRIRHYKNRENYFKKLLKNAKLNLTTLLVEQKTKIAL